MMFVGKGCPSSLFRAPSSPFPPTLPVCPKCHKMISERKWQRHQERCGVHHRNRPPSGLYVPSATPPWEGTQTGILVNQGSRRSKSSRKTAYLVVAVVVVILLALLLLASLGA